MLHVDPGTAAAWSPEEVARRWVGVFPVCVDGAVDALLDTAQAMGQCWLKGLGVAKRSAQTAGGSALAVSDSMWPP